MNGLDELTCAYRERDRAALEWKVQGGQVVGCLGSDVPEEFLIAAGFLTVRVCGDPAVSAEAADRYIERAFDPLVRSQFARIVVDGAYSYLDHLVVSRSCDALVRVFYYLRDLRRLEPSLPVPNLYFFDLLHSRYRTSALYNRDRMRDLKRVVERWCGRPIAPEAIAEAIATCEENRRLLRRLAALRAPGAPRVSGVQALQVVGASMFLPREQHSRLLREFLAEAEEYPPLSGVRLFVTGSAQGPMGVVHLGLVQEDTVDGWSELKGEQGDLMGRPGRVIVRVYQEDGVVSDLEIAGGAVEMLKGTVRL